MKIRKIVNKEKIKVSTWFMSVYLLLTPLDFMPVLQGVSISKILIFLPIGGCLLFLKSMKVRIDKYYIIPILYITMNMMTIIYSRDSSMTMQRTISVLLNISVILILPMLKYNKTEIKVLKNSIVLSGWLTILLMLIYSSEFDGRLTVVINGTYQDPNYLTGGMIFSIVYYLEEFMIKKKFVSLVKFSVFLIFVLLTGSRGGTIAILASSFFYIASRIKSSKIKISSILFIISLVLGLGLVFNLVISLLPDTLAQRYDISYTLADGGANRFNIWRVILYNFERASLFNKFFGMGAGTIRYFTYGGFVGHNVWVESLMEIGIIGVSILFSFYLMYIVKAYKIGEYVVFASFIGYLIMTLSMSLYSYKPIWNILLLIMILKNNRVTANNDTQI